MRLKTYDEAEERFIILHHKEMTAKELSVKLALEPGTVYGICNRLGLKAKCGKRVRKIEPIVLNPYRTRVSLPDPPKKKMVRPQAIYSNTGGYLAVQNRYL